MRLSAVVLLTATVMPIAGPFQRIGPEFPQQSDTVTPSSVLQVTNETTTSILGGLAGRPQCDDEGNIYLRPIDSETSKRYHPTSALPIRKVTTDGNLSASFSITEVAPHLLATDFFVAGDGRVYQAARNETDRAAYVVSYSPDGAKHSKVRLDADFFVPYRLVVFKSGEFLVSGIHGPSNRTPFTAVFRGDGSMVKEIYTPEDEEARKRATAGEPGYSPDEMNSSNDFVVRGDAALGSDNNAYLLRAASPALVYVISSKGEVVRTLRLSSPDPALTAERLKSAPGLFAVAFLKKGEHSGVINVFDLAGQRVATYSPSDARMYPGLLGCFSGNSFSFIGMENGSTIHLNVAKPR